MRESFDRDTAFRPAVTLQSYRRRSPRSTAGPFRLEFGGWSRAFGSVEPLVVTGAAGEIVLDGTSRCHPATRARIWVGENPIGGSTSGPLFTGSILAIEQTMRPFEP